MASNAPAISRSNVGRQVSLPMRKAIEIAYKNIRMRLSRSLLVTSGIILALAFLMSIRTTNALVDGMREWVEAHRKVDGIENMAGLSLTPLEFAARRDFERLSGKVRDLKNEISVLESDLRQAAVAPPTLPAGAKVLALQDVFDMERSELQKDVGSLPASEESLLNLASAKGEYVQKLQRWAQSQRELKQATVDLGGPKQLEAAMAANGLTTDRAGMTSSKAQTRWLLGLALLVAFVGILNAMLMSVTERFREIGTMKCLGALDSFVVKLFLIESLFQGIVGTILGITMGLILSLGANSITYGAFIWKNPPMGDVAASAALCFVVGVGLTVAGAVYPAWRAARMQPIEAMRVEA